MTRKRFLARIDGATPALMFALLAVSFTVLVARAWTVVSEGPHIKRASGFLTLPEKPTPALIAHGDSIFHGPTAPGTCAICHGENGTGSRLGPPLTNSRRFRSDGTIESIARAIRVGIAWHPPAVLPSMPPYAGTLDREQIWAVAAYVYSISRPGS